MTPFLRKLLGQNWLLLVTMLALAIFGVVPDSVPRNASDASPAAFGSHCWSALPAHPDAARFGRGDYLDSGAPCAVVRRGDAAALFDLHHSRCNRVCAHRHQFRT